MGLQLPGELVEVLGLIGLNWPEADEEKLFELGTAWLQVAGGMQSVAGQAETAASQVWQENSGDAITAFKSYWSEHGPGPALGISADAATILGAGLIVYAAIVLGLKINMIVQLVILAIEIAEAIATAGPTFGASLLEVPVFQQLTRTIVENLIWEVIGAIIGG
jgi:hypothetical protein